jgi:Cu2+-exporting ATPase
MNHMMRDDHQEMTEPHTGHNMSEIHASHDRHAGHSVAMFRDKFWLSFILTVPILFWLTDVQLWFGYTSPSFPGSRFIPAILGTVVFVYGGLVFIRGAWRELADRKPGMMTLISLGIIVAFGTSLAGTFGLFDLEVWWELASLITIMILGH